MIKRTIGQFNAYSKKRAIIINDQIKEWGKRDVKVKLMYIINKVKVH